MFKPSDLDSAIKHILILEKRVKRLQKEKKEIKRRLDTTPGGRTFGYKANIAEELILEFAHGSKSVYQVGCDDDDNDTIRGKTLQQFRNRVHAKLGSDLL